MFVNERREIILRILNEQRSVTVSQLTERFGVSIETIRRDLDYLEKQQKLQVHLNNESGQITNRYIRGDERSFTIIAYPVPAIGEKFEEIFRETVKINTLDYNLYQEICYQQNACSVKEILLIAAWLAHAYVLLLRYFPMNSFRIEFFGTYCFAIDGSGESLSIILCAL